MTAPIRCSDEVADALSDGRAVIALESTIIAHGMPSPRNVETAHAIEATVRGGFQALPRVRVDLSTAEVLDDLRGER